MLELVVDNDMVMVPRSEWEAVKRDLTEVMAFKREIEAKINGFDLNRIPGPIRMMLGL